MTAAGKRDEGRESDCPCCTSEDVQEVLRLPEVPTRTSVAYRSREEARNVPHGRIDLVRCRNCGFMWNAAFQNSLVEYSEHSEEAQNYSGRFSAHMDDEIARLINAEGFTRKTVLEIGCGKGDFLARFCELGRNSGIGFDPAFVEGRFDVPEEVELQFHKRLFDFDGLDVDADLIALRMTLEHVPDIGEFVEKLVRSAVRAGGIPIYVTIPNAEFILSRQKFCDILYEHVNYFTRAALQSVFRRFGYGFDAVHTDFGDQHLWGIARPSKAGRAPEPVAAEVIADVTQLTGKVSSWSGRLQRFADQKQAVIVWGSGSKAAAFFNQTGAGDLVSAVVDINPHRHGTYVPGAGVKVVPPGWLQQNPPDIVIIMNPIYRDEISAQLAAMGLTPQILELD